MLVVAFFTPFVLEARIAHHCEIGSNHAIWCQYSTANGRATSKYKEANLRMASVELSKSERFVSFV